MPHLPCLLEPLEPRLLLDTSGPQIVAHWPDGLINTTVDHVEVTFNDPIDPATFTVEDVSVVLTAPVQAGFYDTPGYAYNVQVVGTLAYVADDYYGLWIIDVSNPAAPVPVGRTTGSAWSVQVVGTLAYVADRDYGLRIIDVSNPAAPVQRGYYDTPGSAWSVQVVGSLAYVADGYSGLGVVDVSNPAAPVPVGYYDTPGQAIDVQVVGTLAYVADYDYGLRIIDVSNPAAPVEVGYYDTPDYAWGVQVVGAFAYVADGESGLRIIDVSNPAAPAEVGFYDTPGYALGVQVVGALAYVADGSSGLRIIDVSNPAAQEVSQVDATTYRVQFAAPPADGAYRVFVGPGIADLAGNTMDQDADGIGGEMPDDVYNFSFTIDMTPPTVPGNLVFADDTGSTGDGVTADTELVFTWSAATDANGILRYEWRLDGGDWTATTDTTVTLTFVEGSYSLEVRAVDNAGNSGPAASKQVAVDLTPPTAPSGLDLDGAVLSWTAGTDLNGIWKHQYSIDGGVWTDVAGTSVATGLADGTTHDLAVRAVDRAGNVGAETSATLTVDYGPRIVSHWPDGLIGMSPDHVEVTFNEPIDPGTFTAEDVSFVRAAPVQAGFYDTPGYAYNVHVVGTLAYVADYGSGLRIIDVSNPAAPVEVGYCDTPGWASGVQVVGNLAYVADYTSGLRIIDVSNPAAPVQRGYYDTLGQAQGVQVVGAFAYVADGEQGLWIIDVSNPAVPVQRGDYDTPGWALGVQVVGTLAYVADYDSGLRIIDVSNPAAPHSVGYYDTPGYAYGVQVVGALAYVADGTFGLWIIDVSNPAAPVQRGYYDTPGYAMGVQVVGALAYVTDGYSGLRIIKVGQTGQSVSQVDATTYRVQFAAPMADRSYNVFVGPNIADLAGNTMDQDADNIGGEVLDDVYSFSFTVDTTPPTAPGSLSLVDDTGSTGDGVTADTELVFTWSAAADLNGISRYEYRPGGGDWTATTGRTVTVTLGEGSHSFEVRAVDNVGNAGPAASVQVVVDLTPPSAPSDLDLDKAVLSWSAGTDLNGIWKHQYAIDGGVWTDVAGTSVATGLADGTTHDLAVRAVDRAGNVGPETSATLTVDYGPRIVGHWPDGLINTSVDHVEVTFNDPIDPATFTTEDVSAVLTTPAEMGYYDTPGHAYDVEVVGTMAYVADGYSGLRIIDVSNPAAPIQAGLYDTPGPALGVDVVGTLAYVADYYYGLRIIDVSNPAAPFERGYYDTPGGAYGVQVVGTLAYVADDYSGLRIIDVSNPAAPAEVGCDDMPGYAHARGVQVVGALAYVTDGYSGLRIIKVGQTGQSVSQVDATTYRVQFASTMADGAYRVFVGPGIADLAGNTMDQDADGIGGEVLDDVYNFSFITDATVPAAPIDLVFPNDTGSVDNVTVDTDLIFTWSAPQDVAGIASYEYLWDGGTWTSTTGTSSPVLSASEGKRTFEVRAVDVFDRIGETGSLTVFVDRTAPDAPTGLRLDGAVLHWDPAADANGIWKYQVLVDGGEWGETPGREAQTGLADGAVASFAVRAVDRAGNVGPWASATLTADYGPKVVIHTPEDVVDVAGSLTLTVTFNEPIDPSTLTAEDVQIVPSSPRLLGGYYTGGYAEEVVISGTLAYMADGEDGGLRIFDVSDPSAPQLLGTCDTPGTAWDVAVSGTIAYVADGYGGLAIIDVSNPSAPVLVGTYASDDAWSVVASGSLVYLVNGDSLHILDMSNPSSPVLLGTWYGGWTSGLAVSGTLAYVASGYGYTGLYIIDVSDTSSPQRLGSCWADGVVWDVAVSGNLAYLANGYNGLQIIDVSDPYSPTLLGTYETDGKAVDVEVSGTLVYVTVDDGDGLIIIDASDPTSPVLLGGYGFVESPAGVAVVGAIAYVADGDGGLQILEVLKEVSGVTAVSDATYRIDLPGVLPDDQYHVCVGPEVTDLAGNTMDQDGDGVGGQIPADVYGFDFVIDTTPPVAPVNLAYVSDTGSADKVTASEQLTFSWSAPRDLSGIATYEYRWDGGTWTSTTGTSSTDLPAPEDEHTFEVRAVDTFDRIGQTASLTVFVDTTAPDAPTGLRLDGAVLHWDPAADANGIWKYQVRVDDGEWSETFFPQARTNLGDGTGGLCEVRAVDKAGNVGPTASATLAPDYGPQILSHDVENVMGLVESFTVTFNEQIDSSTLTADDVRIVLPTPTLVSPGYAPGGYVDDVIFAGTRVYVIAERTIHILDVSGPSASLSEPQYLGEVEIPLGTISGGISGTLMYLTLGADGLQLVDLSDPSSPVWMPVYDMGGWADESAASGTRLYVMVKDRGLVILDVSDPASPALLGCQEISDELEVVAGPGSLVYLSDEKKGVYIVDASNPKAPTLLSHYAPDYDIDNVTVYGTQAYLVDGDTGLHILDVSNPLSPVLLGSYDDGGYVEALAVSGTLAFLAIEDHGLQILDVSDPYSPVLLGIYDTEDPCGVAVSGEVVYVPDGAGGLVILEVMQKVAGVTAVDATTYRIDLEGELPDGEYRVFFGPDVIDQAGNTMDQDYDGVGGQPSDTYALSFTVAKMPPTAPGNLAFTDDTGLAGDGLTADAELVFTWTAATDGNGILRYEYRLDSGVWTPTMNLTVTLTLAEGSYSFEVRAVDNVGNAGPATSVQATVDLTAPQTTGVIVNGGMVQRAKITLLAASFNEAVVCAAGALTLTNVTTSEQFNLSGVPFNPATHTWDLSGVELTNGYYTARLSAGAVEDLAGNPMSADYTFTFHRLAGDTTGDGCVDAADYITLKCRFGRVGGAAWDSGDLDGDGDVDWSDLQTMMGSFGTRGAAPAAAPATPKLTPAEPAQAGVTEPTESPMPTTPVAKVDAVAEPELLTAPVADTVAEPELLPAPVANAAAEPELLIAPVTDALAEPELLRAPMADAPPADILAIAASVLGNRLAVGRQGVPLTATRPADSLPPTQVAVRVGPVPTFPSSLLSLGRACPMVADVLQLAGPWWSSDSARHESPDEPLMTTLFIDITGRLRKGRLDVVLG